MGEVIGIEDFRAGERGPGTAALTIPSQGEARDRALRAQIVNDVKERDCPGCRSAGSVSGGFCQVCYADQVAGPSIDDHGTTPAADLPPAAGDPLTPVGLSEPSLADPVPAR